MGGFIAAKQPLIDAYLMGARQRLFSIALTIPDTAALLEAVDMLAESEDKVEKLWLVRGKLSARADSETKLMRHETLPYTPARTSVYLGE